MVKPLLTPGQLYKTKSRPRGAMPGSVFLISEETGGRWEPDGQVVMYLRSKSHTADCSYLCVFLYGDREIMLWNDCVEPLNVKEEE